MAATIEGGGEVCPQPIGSARSRPEMSANRGGIKSARGARSSARSSSRSLTPLARMASVNWARSSDSATVMTGPYPANVLSLTSTLRKGLLEPQTRIMVGEIEPKRRDRNFLGRQRREVRPFRLFVGAALEHQPEIRKAAAVAPLLDPHQFGVASALAGELDPRHEDGANDGRGVPFPRVPFDHRPPDRAAIGLRQSDRGNAEQRAFHRAGDGARISDVFGHVLSAIDARKDKIWRMVSHDLPHPHDDAVRWRALQREMAWADFSQAKRVAKRQRMGDARLVVFRRDDRHVVRQLARDQFEELESSCMDAVVIGEKDSHRRTFRTGSAWTRGASCGKTIPNPPRGGRRR